jgi:hypothetical protein
MSWRNPRDEPWEELRRLPGEDLREDDREQREDKDFLDRLRETRADRYTADDLQP